MEKYENKCFNTKAFTLIELLVVISIIALLLSILVPALTKVKNQAKKTVCLSNIRQLNVGLATYAAEHNDKAFAYYDWTKGISYMDPWYRVIMEYIGDHKAFESGKVNEDNFGVLLCPEAKQVATEAQNWVAGDDTVSGKTHYAWKSFNGSEGSYGFNMWLYSDNMVRTRMYASGLDTFVPNLFGRLSATSGRVVTFADSCRSDFLVFSTEAGSAADYELSQTINKEDPMANTTVTSSWTGLARLCMDRHNKAINMGFTDGSAENVKLDDIFLQKWSKGTIKYDGFTAFEGVWKF